MTCDFLEKGGPHRYVILIFHILAGKITDVLLLLCLLIIRLRDFQH